MKRLNKKNVATVFVAVTLLLIYFDAQVPSNYAVGMSLDQAVSISKKGLVVDGDGCDEETLAPGSLHTDVHFYAYDLETGLELEFNHYERLIKTRRWKYAGINVLKICKSIGLIEEASK